MRLIVSASKRIWALLFQVYLLVTMDNVYRESKAVELGVIGLRRSADDSRTPR